MSDFTTATVGTERADRVADVLADRDVDMLLVTDLVNVRWLTGFTGSSGAAVVGREGERRFVTDFRYLTQSAEQLDPVWEREISVDLLAGVVKRLPGTGDVRLGFEDAHMTVKDHAKLQSMVRAGIELVAAGDAVGELRAVKDEGELDAIRAAARLADDALTEVLGRGLVGRTEREVALDLEFTMRRMGAEAASFPPIVAAGEHGALPHAVPRDVEIPRGTLVVLDLGARLDGYCSDCTRTFATGELPEAQSEAYEAVLAAQRLALDEVRAGVSCKAVDADAREALESRLGLSFEHGLGHGVGLEVHEGPRLARTAEGELEAGNVVTVEPGVYLPGEFGIRIEDLVAVTEGGCEILTGFTKELVTVD
jgi:Xaa-Pro aminopeptidase